LVEPRGDAFDLSQKAPDLRVSDPVRLAAAVTSRRDEARVTKELEVVAYVALLIGQACDEFADVVLALAKPRQDAVARRLRGDSQERNGIHEP
jgi:hypothetical protein